MKLVKKSTIIHQVLNFKICSSFLSENITDFKSLSLEVEEQLKLWLDRHSGYEKIGFTDFKTQMIALYHFDKKTPYTTLNYWQRRGWSKDEASEKVYASQSAKLKSTLLYWTNTGLSAEQAEKARAAWQGDTRNKNRINLENKGLDSQATMLTRDRKASFRTSEFWKAKGMEELEIKAKLKEIQGRDWTATQREALKKNSKRSAQYFISRGFTADMAKNLVAEHQATFSLQKCIEKYGKEKGLIRWQNRQEKWHRNYKKSNYSKISQKLFQSLVPFAPDCLFAERFELGKNAEYVFRTSAGSVYKLDFWVPSKKRIIEFDGDYWHGANLQANPAREAKRDDEIVMTDMAIKILHIREHDYRKNPEGVVKQCKEFLSL